MLDALRKGAGSIAAKILLGILILSFAVWGVGDMIVGRPSNSVASIGGESVSIEEYQRRFDRELTLFGLRIGRRLSPQEGRSIGLDQRVLGQLLVDAHARKLGLGLGDEAIAARIQQIPMFKGSDGKFSKARFDEMIRQLGFTEQGFVHYERLESIRNQILTQLRTLAPSTLVEAANRFENEERKVEHFTVPLAKAGAVAEPDAARLKEFFEQNSRDFMAPETRKLIVALATPDALKSKVSVTPEEVRELYDKNLSRYGTPEKRRVQQITFPDKAAAEKAHAELSSGKDFLEVAKAAGRSQSDIDRGLVDKSGLVDRAIAEAAFALAKDAFSAPVEGALSTSIVRVSEIIAGVQKPFEEVRQEIEEELRLERARRLIGKLHDDVEDRRAAATPLKEIAGELGLKLVEIAAATRDGKDREAKPIAELEAFPQILKLAYESDVGVETDPVDLGRDGYAWVDVLEVTPERQKTLDEVKEAAEAAYIAAEGKRLLTKLAEELADRAEKGEDIAKLAGEAGGTVATSAAFKRGAAPESLPPTLPQRAFSLAKGGAASVASADGKSRVVFRVIDIAAPKPLDEASRKALSEALARQAENDLSAQYAEAVQQSVGLSIDQSVMQRIAGEASQ
jgi:peptidyl-prolyl cis-trans isomerase D